MDRVSQSGRGSGHWPPVPRTELLSSIQLAHKSGDGIGGPEPLPKNKKRGSCPSVTGSHLTETTRTRAGIMLVVGGVYRSSGAGDARRWKSGPSPVFPIPMVQSSSPLSVGGDICGKSVASP